MKGSDIMATDKSQRMTAEEREKKLNNELKEIRKKRRQKEKEEHLKILTEIGVVCEKMLGRKYEIKDIDKLYSFLEKQEARGKYYSNAMNE